MKTTINSTIKDWYLNEFPVDKDLGNEIGYEVTFEDLYETLNKKFNVYETLGVYDSIVRERCFSELARILNVEYEAIYRRWLETNN